MASRAAGETMHGKGGQHWKGGQHGKGGQQPVVLLVRARTRKVCMLCVQKPALSEVTQQHSSTLTMPERPGLSYVLEFFNVFGHWLFRNLLLLMNFCVLHIYLRDSFGVSTYS